MTLRHALKTPVATPLAFTKNSPRPPSSPASAMLAVLSPTQMGSMTRVLPCPSSLAALTWKAQRSHSVTVVATSETKYVASSTRLVSSKPLKMLGLMNAILSQARTQARPRPIATVGVESGLV